VAGETNWDSMKTWKRYRELLGVGEWHIHTRYTDGHNTIEEYCQKATDLGVPLIAFTEHVRRDLDYDFNAFLADIEEARDTFDLIILSGCEAGILPGGGLNVPEWILREVDYPIVSFHAFPCDIKLYIHSLIACFRSAHVNTWAHPGAFLNRFNLALMESEIVAILKEMAKRDIALESNRKYAVPEDLWIELAARYCVPIVRGSDVHTVEDLSAV